jgi:sRNA-binding regulator protein Hfq
MKLYLTCLLGSVLVLATMPLSVAAQPSRSQPMTVDNIKSKVAKLGVGDKAKATVFLKNGTKLKGYIAQAGDSDFVLRDRKTDAPSTISYDDVARIDSNKGHSTARNIAIGVGIGAGALLAIILITIAHLD